MYVKVVLPNNITIIALGTVNIVGDESLNDHLFTTASSVNGSLPGINDVHLENLNFTGQRNIRMNCIQIVANDTKRSRNIRLKDITVQE